LFDEETELERFEDVRLSRGLKAGDRHLWGEFCASYSIPLYRFTAARCDSSLSAEDLAQEALATAVERIDDFDVKKGALWPWLCGIALNKIREGRRRLNRELRLRKGLASEIPDERPEETKPARDIHQVLSLLHPRHQEILIMKYLEGRSQRDIASQLHLGEKAVESRLTRARDSFKRASETLSVNELEEKYHD